MKTYNIPIFVPHKGCPHDCVFCNQRKITGQMDDIEKEAVVRTIEENLKTMDKDAYIEVAFFGGSFTGIDIDKQTELLKIAYSYVQEGKINGIRCSTRADYITDDILTNLKTHGTVAIELGVQSTDDDVLRCSKRGHTFHDVIKASKKIKSYGIKLGLQMMLGLPGDTREKMIKTAEDLISLKPDCVRIYPTLVVPDTALWDMYENGIYTPLSLEETVDILSVIIPMFEKEGIDVIRVGLQTTDNINQDTVKGPYHPAIRELANGKIIQKLIQANMDKEAVNVCINPNRMSETVGHKRCNREYFKKTYGVDMIITTDKSIDENTIIVNDKKVSLF